MRDRPLVFVGPMWRGLREWAANELVGRGLASPGDLETVHWVATLEEALDIVREARNAFLERHEVVLPPAADEAEGEHGAKSPRRPAGTPR
jgi:predicted Rossmann-fold nucleotide-binding protein